MAFHKHHLIDYIPWHELSPQILRQKVMSLLADQKPYKEAISRFQLTGIETMCRRLNSLRCQRA
jgi:hypothetical protein